MEGTLDGREKGKINLSILQKKMILEQNICNKNILLLLFIFDEKFTKYILIFEKN